MPNEPDMDCFHVPKGRGARVTFDDKRRLNKMFYPMAIIGDECLMMTKFVELTKPAQRLLSKLLSQCSVTSRVVYWSTQLNDRQELSELVKADVIRRPTAAQFPRRKGFTTVLINPHLVLTIDESMEELWAVCESGLSTLSEEPTHPV